MNARSAWLFGCVLSTALVAAPLLAADAGPSRPPGPKCAWERIADATVGLQAWVQRCDYGFRKIDFLFAGKSLAIRYSDGGGPDPLVDVHEMLPGESHETAIRRVFLANTDPKLAARCVLAPWRGYGGHNTARAPAGAKRYAFLPNRAYRQELKAKADPNEVGDPPCGDWGDAPDGIQYFEAWPRHSARKVLFVRVGQDEPLFDEQSLQLIAPAGP